ncbi:MAG: ATP-dependent Clp protease ATP-binding subunit [Oscillospiraceae bacterium]|nr:ATP-dependent Clp protease ATP-binding subunit [Oscillospiraceae bacterium]
MRANQFTPRAQTALRLAQETAGQLGHSYVGSEHLLLGLLREEESSTQRFLCEHGIKSEQVIETLVGIVGRGLAGLPPSQGLTPRARRIIEYAAMECAKGNSGCVGTEHLLLGILREEGSMAVRVLRSLGAEPRVLQTALLQRRGLAQNQRPVPPRVQRETGNRPTAVRDEPVRSKALEQFTKSLNAMAREGKLDPVVGREREISRTIRILCRRTKNNPVLIGEPGVGKTAVAEALAQRIVEGTVPEELRGATILSIDLAAMLAGTKYRGEFEERVKNALAEVRRRDNMILFIDELHTIVGAGSAEGAVDAANILKPALGRGEIRVIGATTLDEYRRYIEKDAALERRFQTVTVDEPGSETAVEILMGLRERYEAHHNVAISGEAIQAAVDLSSRYLPDRCLPDKAIDLMDEACSRVRLDGVPKAPDMTILEQRLEQVRREKAQAIAGEDFEGAAKLRDVEEDFSRQLQEEREKMHCDCFPISVTAEDIAEVASEWTGIPVRKITQSERERLLHLEDELRESVVGQDEALKSIARAIRRSRMGLKEPGRPVGSFLLLGSTGVGKTQLCRALSRALFAQEDAMIRMDMSEYAEGHSTSRLVGAPPGYVGHDDGGQLTERVRRRPYSVVLFDEIEKAHGDVWNLLLQIMEDGQLTDSHGRRVDFRNTVIVMTSNVGAQHLTRRTGRLGFSVGGAEQDADRAVIEELRATFRPEFLNRVDETIIFRKLEQKDLVEIARRMVADTASRLNAQGIMLSVDESALELLAHDGCDSAYGARPLRRLIRTRVEETIADGILDGRFHTADTLLLTQRENSLVIDRKMQ